MTSTDWSTQKVAEFGDMPLVRYNGIHGTDIVKASFIISTSIPAKGMDSFQKVYSKNVKNGSNNKIAITSRQEHWHSMNNFKLMLITKNF